MFTASAIMNVYNKVNPTNKKKMEDLANGKKSDLMKLQSLAMKFVKQTMYEEFQILPQRVWSS